VCSQRMPALAPMADGQLAACWMHVAGSGHSEAPELKEAA
jgi:peptide/nickel transport system ATP-binding protein